ncbi:MAG: rubrerythrin family protein [Haloarculaceae archaeon]
MDASEFTDAVRDENRTALSRLGSSKALYADTEGEMNAETILGAAADRAYHAAETFAAWADEESDEEAGDLFSSVAASERDHHETIVDERGEHEPGDPPAVQQHLRGVEETTARLGALVGWALTATRNTDQLVGYFVGQADPQTASTFRDISGDQEEYVDDAAGVLADVVADEEREDALAAASDAVQADYDAYFETLESLGINPKPVC